jgi:hypothetical protein
MYNHTQIGWILIAFFAPAIIIMAIWAVLYPLIYSIATAVVLLAALVVFGALTVKCDLRELTFYFGPGIIKRRIKYGEIQTAKKVRNHWYYGWGIRWYGAGWLYNVSGLDAVELRLRNGQSIRIGTDEPDKLHGFITQKLTA